MGLTPQPSDALTPGVELPPLSACSFPATLRTQQPWESATALQRLCVPSRILPENCPVVTRWVVLTGATCAGKTTTIRALEQRGFTVLHEVARSYVEKECASGRSVADVRANDLKFRETVFSRTIDAEVSLMPRAHEVIFLDRSALDSISFHRASGYNPNDLLGQLLPYRYHHVFHLNQLPFQHDGFRTFSEVRRSFLDASLERDYRALEYSPLRVPAMSVEERVQFILERLSLVPCQQH